MTSDTREQLTPLESLEEGRHTIEIKIVGQILSTSQKH